MDKDTCFECGEHKECNQMVDMCSETGWKDIFPACNDCVTDPDRVWAGERMSQ